MNPFGIGQAISALVELAVSVVTRKSRKEKRREQQQFLFAYLLLMILGIGAVVWTIYSLYFQK